MHGISRVWHGFCIEICQTKSHATQTWSENKHTINNLNYYSFPRSNLCNFVVVCHALVRTRMLEYYGIRMNPALVSICWYPLDL